MAQWPRACITLTEDLSLVSSPISGGSQLTAVPSFGISRQLHSHVHTYSPLPHHNKNVLSKMCLEGDHLLESVRKGRASKLEISAFSGGRRCKEDKKEKVTSLNRTGGKKNLRGQGDSPKNWGIQSSSPNCPPLSAHRALVQT